MTKTKLPPEAKRIDAIELFRVLRSLSAFTRGVDVYDWEAGEAAAMILLSRLGLAVPMPELEYEDPSWVLTVKGNERLVGLLTELRQWDPNCLAKPRYRWGP